MIRKYIGRIIDSFGVWRCLQVVFLGFSLIFIATTVSQFIVPLSSFGNYVVEGNNSGVIAGKEISVLLGKNKKKTELAVAYRPGMFRPATCLRDKPIANKTIERIKGQLKLQCVMEINNELVAYITIQGVGLKKCCVGENVNGLFTVLNINEQNKSVDLSIIEHKVTLNL